MINLALTPDQFEVILSAIVTAEAEAYERLADHSAKLDNVRYGDFEREELLGALVRRNEDKITSLVQITQELKRQQSEAFSQQEGAF